MTPAEKGPRFAFAGDREIAVRILTFLTESGHQPRALLVTEPGRATHASELRALCPQVPAALVFEGSAFSRGAAVSALRQLELEYIVFVHFPYVVPRTILEIARKGCLNLHPAFLPWNRGWHTPSWAILDGTPYGATLHVMSEELDAGDILAQRSIEVSPGDTAHRLYGRVLDLEVDLFKETWPELVGGRVTPRPQSAQAGARAHQREELLDARVRSINLERPMPPRALIDRLRALTTDRWEEAAYFDVDGRRFRVRVTIVEAPASGVGEGETPGSLGD